MKPHGRDFFSLVCRASWSAGRPEAPEILFQLAVVLGAGKAPEHSGGEQADGDCLLRQFGAQPVESRAGKRGLLVGTELGRNVQAADPLHVGSTGSDGSLEARRLSRRSRAERVRRRQDREEPKTSTGASSPGSYLARTSRRQRPWHCSRCRRGRSRPTRCRPTAAAPQTRPIPSSRCA